jgi:hypothetical protein
MSEENAKAKGPLLTRALGEDKVPIFFDVKEIKAHEEIIGGAELEVEFKAETKPDTFNELRHETQKAFQSRNRHQIIMNSIIPYRGQMIPGSWFLVDKQTLKEIKSLIDQLYLPNSPYNEKDIELRRNLQEAITKALES